MNWEPTLVNYLRLIPGRTGIPLSYVIRRRATPSAAQLIGPILDNYITHAPLVGDTFNFDSQSVHTLILTFIVEYPEIESDSEDSYK